MKRLSPIILAILALSAPAYGASRKPLVMSSTGQASQLQTGDTLADPAGNTYLAPGATLDLTKVSGINTSCGADNAAILNAINFTGITRVEANNACIRADSSVTWPTGIDYNGHGTTELRFANIGASATGLTIAGSETSTVPLATSGSSCPTVTVPNITAGDTAVYSCALPTGLTTSNANGARISITSGDTWAVGYTKGWQVKVLSITGCTTGVVCTINLVEPVPAGLDMTSGNTPVFSYLSDNGPTAFQGFKVTGPFTDGANSQRCVLIYRASRVTWRNNVVEGCDGTNIEVNRSYDVELSGGSTNSVYATGLGYGIVISYGTVNAYVHDMTADNVNDFLATGGYSLVNRRTSINNVHATCRWYCFNAHESQLDYSVSNSVAQAHSSANTANQGMVYNGAGNLTVTGNKFLGMRATGILVQPVVSANVDTNAAITGNVVTMGANASTKVGIYGFPYSLSGTGVLNLAVTGNVVNGGDYSISIASLNNGQVFGRVSITSNTVGAVPASRAIFANITANTTSPVLDGLVIANNNLSITAASEMLYLTSTASGLISNVTIAGNSFLAGAAGSIPIRLTNVAGLNVSCGKISGSPTNPWLMSGNTDVQFNCNYGLPTISSGFGTSPTAPSGNGIDSFQLTVGSTPGSTGVLAFKASPLGNGWSCTFTDATTPASHSIAQTATTSTTVTVTDYSRTTGVAQNFAAGDVILGSCKPY